MAKNHKPMSEATKVRLRELMSRKPKLSKLTDADWQIACDALIDELGEPSQVMEQMRQGRLEMRAPSFVPAAAVDVLRQRLPHVMVTLAAGPGRTRRMRAFWSCHLVVILRFLGILKWTWKLRPTLASSTIQFPKRMLPLEVRIGLEQGMGPG